MHKPLTSVNTVATRFQSHPALSEARDPTSHEGSVKGKPRCIYSVILGFRKAPMKLFVPPRTVFGGGYLA